MPEALHSGRRQVCASYEVKRLWYDVRGTRLQYWENCRSLPTGGWHVCSVMGAPFCCTSVRMSSCTSPEAQSIPAGASGEALDVSPTSEPLSEAPESLSLSLTMKPPSPPGPVPCLRARRAPALHHSR